MSKRAGAQVSRTMRLKEFNKVNWRRTTLRLFIAVLGFLTAILPVHASETDVLPGDMRLSRYHDPTYTPGSPVEITVSIHGQAAGEIRALGLVEILPAGWTFLALRGQGGTPHVVPESGAEAPLEFAWITPPRMPSTFAYTVLVPEDARGPQYVRGMVEYRYDSGPHQTPETVTELSGPPYQPPRLHLYGANAMEMQAGTSWTEPGYSAIDYNKRDISHLVAVNGVVDAFRPGIYTLNYEVTSQTSGLSGTARRTVRVIGSAAEQAPESGPRPSPADTLRPAPRPPRPATTIAGLEQPGAIEIPTRPEGAAPELPLSPDLLPYRPVASPHPASNRTEDIERNRGEESNQEKALRPDATARGLEVPTTRDPGQLEDESSDGTQGEERGGMKRIAGQHMKPERLKAVIAVGLVALSGAGLWWRLRRKTFVRNVRKSRK